jgi:regulator of sigma E protease
VAALTARTFQFDGKSNSWVSAFARVQSRPVQEVELVVNKASERIRLTPEPDPTAPRWFYPLRGLRFLRLIRELPPQEISAALHRGFDDTVENILNIYAMFRSLAQQRVSPKVLGGPPAIAQMAYASAASGAA